MKGMVASLLLLCALPGHARDQTYQNPVDHKAYTAPGGWQTYAPDGGVPPASGGAVLDSVRLLQPQEEMAARTTVKELSAFIKLVQSAASEVFYQYDKSASLLVQFTCTPGTHVVEIAYQGEPSQDLIQAYYDKLKALTPLRVSGEVRFQIMLKIQS